WLREKVARLEEEAAPSMSVKNDPLLFRLARGAEARLAVCTATSIVKAQAASGASQFQPAARGGIATRPTAPKSRRATLGEGGRGVQDCNCFSNWFISSINVSFHGKLQFI